ncbi:citrate lyase [Afipia sp. P52-10]|jgi:citrate lyase subunit beta/citryl-CoA lyase|uniref:HpcH/HpaI aldolase/citrate lyase family protein n=1 Tax=Afipia sp. P52-10 TaxID=1429916 RepID=UPI0003DF390B|nr:CoA ester lyase [Afipia sp. P52-10]ETR76923.1 citrate lyase [Afipia sp. P52-10]
MNLRSWLFIPGDSDKKLGKADAAGADALILDIEDSVAASNKEIARAKVRAFLDQRPPGKRNSELWVRINPLDDPSSLKDLAAVVGGAPDGIMLPKIDGPADVLRLSHHLEALEIRDGVAPGHVRIMPVATETPVAPLRLNDFVSAKLPRLLGLTWGAEDLSAAIGAATNTDESGEWALTYRWARSTMLLAAKAVGIQAVETLYVNFKDSEGLRKSCRAAAREGFTGRIAIHPDQVAIINEAFAPSAEDVDLARRVIAAFEAQSATGTVGLDGKMLDIPHLKQARKVLEMHEQYQRRGQ